GIRDDLVTGVQTCALPISLSLPGEREGGLLDWQGIMRTVSITQDPLTPRGVGNHVRQLSRFAPAARQRGITCPRGLRRPGGAGSDRKSTRLNSSHQIISYA